MYIVYMLIKLINFDVVIVYVLYSKYIHTYSSLKTKKLLLNNNAHCSFNRRFNTYTLECQNTMTGNQTKILGYARHQSKCSSIKLNY